MSTMGANHPQGPECNHCGGEAIQFKKPRWPGDMWHLYDGDGEKCDECGWPGSVSVDDTDEGPVADWRTNDWDEGLKCNAADCEECRSLDAEGEAP